MLNVQCSIIMTTTQKKLLKLGVQTLINILAAILTALGASAAVIH